MVDLDGARDGRAARRNRTRRSPSRRRWTSPLNWAAGIRRLEDIEELLGGGISRVILRLGGAADEAFLARAAERVRRPAGRRRGRAAGRVAFNGWTQDSGEDYIAFAARAAALGGAQHHLYRYRLRRHAFASNFAQLEALAQAVEVDITASGGIADITDIERAGRDGHVRRHLRQKASTPARSIWRRRVKAGKAYGK